MTLSFVGSHLRQDHGKWAEVKSRPTFICFSLSSCRECGLVRTLNRREILSWKQREIRRGEGIPYTPIIPPLCSLANAQCKSRAAFVPASITSAASTIHARAPSCLALLYDAFSSFSSILLSLAVGLFINITSVPQPAEETAFCVVSGTVKLAPNILGGGRQNKL